jgi:hypothetical protein
MTDARCRKLLVWLDFIRFVCFVLAVTLSNVEHVKMFVFLLQFLFMMRDIHNPFVDYFYMILTWLGHFVIIWIVVIGIRHSVRIVMIFQENTISVKNNSYVMTTRLIQDYCQYLFWFLLL